MHFDLKFFLNQSITLLYSIIIFQVNLFKYYSFILNLSFFIQTTCNFYLINHDFSFIQTKFRKCKHEDFIQEGIKEQKGDLH